MEQIVKWCLKSARLLRGDQERRSHKGKEGEAGVGSRERAFRRVRRPETFPESIIEESMRISGVEPLKTDADAVMQRCGKC